MQAGEAGRRMRARWAAGSVAALGCVALATAPAPAAAATHPGATVIVTIATPKGVPANVTVRSRGARRIVAKRPGGRSARFRLAVRPGHVQILARELLFNGTLYRASVSRASLTATRGARASVRVRYVRVTAARRLRATSVAKDRISLTWSAPRHAVVRLRRTRGQRPPTTTHDGSAVPVQGRSAVDRGLRANTTYSYALFTKSGGRWVGPVTIEAGTAAADPRIAAYVAPPSTVIVKAGDSDADSVTIVPGGVRVRLAANRPTPVIGAGFVLPVSKTLPAGFLGTVTSVAADGRTVQLRAAGLADAFDYYDVDVDLSKAAPIPLTPDPGSAVSPAGRASRARGRAAASLKNCEVSGGSDGSVLLHPIVQPSGHFSGSIVKKWFAPVGAKFDVSAQLQVGLTADVSVSAALACGLHFRKVVETLPTEPVPIAIVFDPSAEVSIGGQMDVKNIGYTATGGFWAKGEIGLHNHADGGLIKSAGPTAATRSWSVPLTASLGGELTVGPGGGSDEAGVVAGVGGKFVPIKATFGPVFGDGDLRHDACIKTSIGFESELNLNAKAWVGGFSISHSLSVDGLHAEGDYAGPWYLPTDCDKLPPGAPESGDALGPGVREIASSTVGDPQQWGHVPGFVPGQEAWILSTGNIAQASIADPEFFASTDVGGDGNATLSGLVGGLPTYDTAAYRVTVLPAGHTLHVRYLFGSEEYPEFVGQGYDDVMAVFVNGVNCALVPGTSDRVSVDSINDHTNAQYYVDNSAGAAGYGTSMDGLTTPLQCDVPVTPGQPVNVEVTIADTGDHIFDSVVGLLDKGIWSD